jgi:hypothetical protein
MKFLVVVTSTFSYALVFRWKENFCSVRNSTEETIKNIEVFDSCTC